MFAYQKQSLPPSGFAFSVSCRITPSCLKANHYSHLHKQSPVSHNLIVARGNFVQIYEVYQDTQPKETHQNDASSTLTPSYRLCHLAQHLLHGVVTGISAIRTLETAEDGLDRILISFTDAKVMYTK